MKDEVKKLFVWNYNHGGEGLILFAAIIAANADEARGALLRNMDIGPQMVEMIRKHAPTEKSSGVFATWDSRPKANGAVA